MTDQMRAVEVPAAGEPFEHVERPVPDPDKEELALEPGADHFVDTSETDAAEALQSMGGARVVLGTAPAADAISNVVGGLGRDGEVVAVGVPGEEVPVDIGHLVGTRGAVKG